MNKIKYQPGCVRPEEYDWQEQFSSLGALAPFTLVDTGKVLGLALAYQELKESDYAALEAENKRLYDLLRRYSDIAYDLDSKYNLKSALKVLRKDLAKALNSEDR